MGNIEGKVVIAGTGATVIGFISKLSEMASKGNLKALEKLKDIEMWLQSIVRGL